jgi:hypothetical protein
LFDACSVVVELHHAALVLCGGLRSLFSLMLSTFFAALGTF